MSLNKDKFYATRERVRKLYDNFGTSVFTSREAGELLGIDMSDAHAEPYRKFMSDFQRLKQQMVVVPVDTKINPETGRIADYYLIVDKDMGGYNRRYSSAQKKERIKRAQEIKNNYIQNIKMKHRFVAPTKEEMNDFHEKFVKESKVKEKHEETPIEKVDEEKFNVEIKVDEVMGLRTLEFKQTNLTLQEAKSRLTTLKEMI